MGTTYKINMANNQDLQNKVEQILSEQSALLTSLGVTITYVTSTASRTWELDFVSSDTNNPFKVQGHGNNNGQALLYNDSTPVGSYVTSVGQYAIIECMEKSMLVAFSSSLTPNDTVKYFAIITKNDDDKVTLMCTYTNNTNAYASSVVLREASFTGTGPSQAVFANPALYVGSFEQYALANLPRKASGKVCDNAFIVLTWSDPIACGIGRVNDVDYAMCMVLTMPTSGSTSCYCMFACK